MGSSETLRKKDLPSTTHSEKVVHAPQIQPKVNAPITKVPKLVGSTGAVEPEEAVSAVKT